MPAAARRQIKASAPCFSLVPAQPVRVQPLGVRKPFYLHGDFAVADAFDAAALRPVCLKRIAITWSRLSPSELRERLSHCCRDSFTVRRACVIGYLADLFGRIGIRHIEVIDALSEPELNRLVAAALNAVAVPPQSAIRTPQSEAL